MRKYSSVLVALLGVLVGVLAVLTVQKAQENKRLLRTEYRDWRKLNLVLQSLDEHYVDTVDRKAVTDAAITAALGALDPHSVYMPPAVLEESETELAGNFDGIGIQFNVPNDTAIVLEVIPGGPSEKIGLQPGDRILKVDSKNIAGVKYPQDSMVRKMRGPSGSKVTITVLRDGETVPFEITRGKIPMNSMDAAFMVNDTTGYLRLSKFARTTYQEVSQACDKLAAQGMKRLIFDLRDNGGGFFDQSFLLADMFLPKGAGVVYLEGRAQPRQNFNATGKGKLQDVALVVLINENSASSSEIFAGAIQDNDRGTIVGRRSFGKGLVQEPIDFNDGSGLRLTVARFYTPSGRCIQKPYDNYEYDIYQRYADGEVFSADSVKLNTEDVHHTKGGRIVYGGGGIMPDVFVPVDTTRASAFFVACNRKATQMRFAAAMFDKYSAQLRSIDSFPAMDAFLKRIDVPGQFRTFALRRDGITVSDAEYKETLPYLEPQLNALVARYSKLSEKAYYKYYLPVDNTVEAALRNSVR